MLTLYLNWGETCTIVNCTFVSERKQSSECNEASVRWVHLPPDACLPPWSRNKFPFKSCIAHTHPSNCFDVAIGEQAWQGVKPQAKRKLWLAIAKPWLFSSLS